MAQQPKSPVDLPSRQGTQASAFSDDAVPETDPSNVRCFPQSPFYLGSPPQKGAFANLPGMAV